MQRLSSPFLLAFFLLLMAGGFWGLSIAVTKIAVSGGRLSFGLIAWQSAFLALFCGIALLVLRRRLQLDKHGYRIAVMVAFIGTLLPNYFSFIAAAKLPAGVMALMISLIPLLAYPVSLLMRFEKIEGLRMAGLLCGAGAMCALLLPEASLPDRAMVPFLAVAVMASLFYACEGNFLTYFKGLTYHPLDLLFVASILTMVLASFMAFATGQAFWLAVPPNAEDIALITSSAAHFIAYSGYIYLVAVAGPVFAAQTAYVSTSSGILWSMLLLSERYSLWIWLAFALMSLGLFLVQPRRQQA